MNQDPINKKKVAVLISGSGSNLQSLIDACKKSDFPACISLVIANKINAYGLERAKNANIPTKIINHNDFASRIKFDNMLANEIDKLGIEIICLAGFMRLLTAEFTSKYAGKMINIHPSLLPKYKGLNTHKRAIEAGEKQAGCTVHFVIPNVDSGEIILQKSVNILASDTEETLRLRVLKQEHIIYPKALEMLATGKALTI